MLNFTLPCVCAICGCTGQWLICPECRLDFFKASPLRCKKCAIDLIKGEQAAICGDCLTNPPEFDETIVAAQYAAPVDQLILKLKFGHQLALADLLSNLLRDSILDSKLSKLPETLCPVPLGAGRLIERGFNQSLEIARPLARDLGITLQPQLLHRIRETMPQSLLHPDDRAKNMQRSFCLQANWEDAVAGRHIGIVDDVMTTGATLNEIAKTLKRFGASRVSNFVFARTPL